MQHCPLYFIQCRTPVRRSYYSDDVSPPNWQLMGNDVNVQLMIRAVVDPVSPVGGMLARVNKLAILAPYLALVGLVGALTVTFAIGRRKP